MALVKNITSDRTGVTTSYHVIQSVSVSGNSMNVLVASFASEEAAKAKKRSVEISPETVPYDGKEISPSLAEYAQAQLLKLPKYAGATVA